MNAQHSISYRSILSLGALALSLILAAPVYAQFQPGDIYVGSAAAQVYRVDASTNTVSVFADSGDGFVNIASGLDFRAGGGLLVQNYATSDTYEFDSAGNRQVVRKGGGRGGAGDGLGLRGRLGQLLGHSPVGQNCTAQDSAGRIYIAMNNGGVIRRFNPDFSPDTSFAAQAPSRSDHFLSMAFLPAGDLLVVNQSYLASADLLRIAPDGTRSTFDNLPGETLHTVAVRDNGDIYVASYSGKIYRYVGGVAAGRVLLTSLGSQDPSLAFSHGSLYHISMGDPTLRRIDPDTGAATDVATGFNLPYSIAVVPRTGTL